MNKCEGSGISVPWFWVSNFNMIKKHVRVWLMLDFVCVFKWLEPWSLVQHQGWSAVYVYFKCEFLLRTSPPTKKNYQQHLPCQWGRPVSCCIGTAPTSSHMRSTFFFSRLLMYLLSFMCILFSKMYSFIWKAEWKWKKENLPLTGSLSTRACNGISFESKWLQFQPWQVLTRGPEANLLFKI